MSRRNYLQDSFFNKNKRIKIWPTFLVDMRYQIISFKKKSSFHILNAIKKLKLKTRCLFGISLLLKHLYLVMSQLTLKAKHQTMKKKMFYF